MPRQWRPEEHFAEEVLRRTLDTEVTGRDDGTAPATADLLFTLPDGCKGALEVTTIGDQDALETEALTAKTSTAVPGARWAWMVHVPVDVSMRILEGHLPTLVLTCEELGVPDPHYVLGPERELPAFQWLSSSGIDMRGFPESNRPGAIDVLPEGGGGVVFEHLDELPAWIEQRLTEPDLQSNLEKLRATGRAEQHLFIRIHESALSWSLYFPLAFGSALPSRTLLAPPGLTGLWLMPRWRNPILWWSSHRGWHREEAFE